MKLMDGGNEYVAAISALDGSQVRVFIRETFRHATQTGKLSFPPTVTESFRPYIKERLVRQDADDEPYSEEGEEGEEWEPASESEESDVTIYDFRPGAAGRSGVGVDDAEDEEE